ncbi:dynamin family protein [Sporolactobacillus nakayamae]|uniref:Dynamin family protein n=1 Tax=Sporolactobacillus nakayamae TaxID=269670 RepID=A0A1I2UBR6_9BACL|nr:dynamin family protein [Sporolactobacillus nakayamae]SFG73819.1 Dynamin family protein [Sporolactobacillus nakayamae]
MGFSLDHYAERKRQFFAKAEKVIKILITKKDEETIQQINDLLGDVENGKFVLTVIGEFSKGKSTFLNSLFGKRLLPSKVTPTTALLNKIIYKEQQSIIVSANGQEHVIPEETFKNLIAPKEPKSDDHEAFVAYQKQIETLNQIDQVTIGYPLSFLSNGICIYDTPGFNDLDENRSQLTNTIIPQSDAVIFMLNARRQLSQSEHSFLENRVLTQDLGKLFFVINFKDQLDSEADVERVRQEILSHLPSKIAHPKLFFISAKYALNFRREQNGEVIKSAQWKMKNSAVVRNLEETGIPALEQALGQFLEEERGYIKIFRADLQLNHWIDRMMNQDIPLEMLSFHQHVADADQKQKELKLKLDHARAERERLMKSIKSNSKKELAEIKKAYQQRLEAILHAAQNEFKKQTGTYKEMARAIEDRVSPLEGILAEDLLKWKELWANDVIQKCAAHMSSELSQNYRSLASSFNVQVEANHEIKLTDMFDSLADAVYRSVMDFAPQKGSQTFSMLASAGKSVVKFIGFIVRKAKSVDDRELLQDRIKDQFEKSIPKKVEHLEKNFKSMQKQLSDKITLNMEKELKKMQELFLKMFRNAEISQRRATKEINKLKEQQEELRACMEINPLSKQLEGAQNDYTGTVSVNRY